MSGPKTSKLDIERMRRAQIAALRDTCVNQKLHLKTKLEEQCLDFKQEFGAEENEVYVSLLALLKQNEQMLDSELELKDTSDLTGEKDRIDNAVKKCTAEVTACVLKMETIIGNYRETSIQKSRMESLEALASGFAETKEVTANVIDIQSLLSNLRKVQETNQAEETGESKVTVIEETTSIIEKTLQEVLPLIMNKATLEKDKKVLLEFVSQVNEILSSENNYTLSLAKEQCAQISLLLPSIKQTTSEMEQFSAKAKEYRKFLLTKGIIPSVPERLSFSTLEEAASYVDALQAEVEEADRDEYIRLCIDKVMERHGFNISRSVVLGKANTGSHQLFTDDESDIGLHAFLSDSGDMLLEVVSVGDDVEGAESNTVLESVLSDSVIKQDELMQAQQDFCSMYDSIADELAEFGIFNSVTYKAPVDPKFCKEIHTAEYVEKKATAPTQMHQDTKKKKTTLQAREMK